jgi:outer membrane protein OmpA-like peptidoglycan-associated protein
MISGDSLTSTSVGTCVVTSTKAADSTYLITSTTTSVSFTAPTRPTPLTITYRGRGYTLNASTKNSLLELSKKLISGADVTVSGYAPNKTLARYRADVVAAYLRTKGNIRIKVQIVTNTRANKVVITTTAQ